MEKNPVEYDTAKVAAILISPFVVMLFGALITMRQKNANSNSIVVVGSYIGLGLLAIPVLWNLERVQKIVCARKNSSRVAPEMATVFVAVSPPQPQESSRQARAHTI